MYPYPGKAGTPGVSKIPLIVVFSIDIFDLSGKLFKRKISGLLGKGPPLGTRTLHLCSLHTHNNLEMLFVFGAGAPSKTEIW
jgi:hypothetical protein